MSAKVKCAISHFFLMVVQSLTNDRACKAVVVRSSWLVHGDAEYMLENLSPEGLFIGIDCQSKREAQDWIRKAERAAKKN